MFSAKLISFEEILIPWSNNLWPRRVSPIESHSAMKFLGGYEIEYFKETPYFVGIELDNKIVACVSGHKTGDYWFRSRGLWVSESLRQQGLGTIVMRELENCAKKENCNIIWTIPRIASLEFYETQGFRRCSNDIEEGLEFGPNCYAIKLLC